MHRILIAQCEQEISSFNPIPSEYELFDIYRGEELISAQNNTNTCIGGAMEVFGARGDVSVLPAYGAFACSAGPLSAEGFHRISTELLDAVRAHAGQVDGMYFCMHGAMGALNETDPEGYLLEETRKILGPGVPIILSLDLHGVLTDRMLRHCEGAAIYHTYPHEDFRDTGARAARLLLQVLDRQVKPVTARIRIPALVRGEELHTATGLFGGIIAQARNETAKQDGVLAAAFMIGNPFTDVPELCCQPVVTTDNDPARAEALVRQLADAFWAERTRMQANLTGLEEAVRDAAGRKGPVVFSDPADAPSSGAPGDSPAILEGLIRHGYPGTALIPLVDPPTVRQAFELGVGATAQFSLGGAFDPDRYPPVPLTATVDMLSQGKFRLEQWGHPVNAGPTAVLKSGQFTIVVITHPIFLLDRALFFAHGQDPEKFDLTVSKSPGAYRRYYTWAEKNYNLDVPGSTSANLPTLGHKVCQRPIFPLDEDVRFEPKVDLYGV